ncbi:hypothetical protein GRI89_17285 [Altererythrobacter salegens]|uniref:Uncharacterized protein n=1 Tax=Croceibacterium salegens TaxID=1737568 RepID=A0A6I4SZ83_9SPHN|nr:hypothetical protein [Croceibacterium salegens]MXO61301.1 hypothetical protein [Croceibacterium salegens]
MKFVLTPNQKILTRYRRGEAMIAIIFPVIMTVFESLAIWMRGPNSILVHPLFGTELLIGLAALGFWIIRYARPALKAVSNRGDPVQVDTSSIQFFGRIFPLSATSALTVDDKRVSLLDGDQVLATESLLFVSGKYWH